MTSLVDRLAAGPPRIRRMTCSVGELLKTLTPAEREAFTAALDQDSGWTNPQLADLIEETKQVSIQSSTIGRHRRRGCSCDRVR